MRRSEGVHSGLRDWSHRLRRRTRGSPKSVAMPTASVAMSCVRSRWTWRHSLQTTHE